MFSYLIIFLFFGSESYGWYRYPFFPFLAISMAVFIKKLFQEPNILIYSLLFLLPFGTSVHHLIGQLGFQSYVGIFRLSLIGLLAVFVLGLLSNNKLVIILQRFIMVLGFLLLVYLSIKEILFLNYDNWFFVT